VVSQFHFLHPVVPPTNGDHMMLIAVQCITSSVETGSGYEGLASAFCGIMNMPCLTKPAY
jgi:hypothetical protein